MTEDLQNWSGRERPERKILTGRFCRLEPLNPEVHGDALFFASSEDGASERFRWLPEVPPQTRAEFQPWLERAYESEDPLYFVVICLETGEVEGRQTLMRINELHGVAEIGNIYWGQNISRTPVTTEAYYLFAKYVFEELGYRRFEWKCDNENVPSKNSASRFGMTAEGLFRQALVIKGRNRDTAWFSLLDHEWPVMKTRFEKWLSAENFDADGKQICKLQDVDTQG